MDADMKVDPPHRPDPGEESIALVTEVFALLSDETRVRLILALDDGEMSVGALAERVGRTPTVVSQHLAKLRSARVVLTRQEGTWVHYRLVDEHVRTLVHQAFLQAEHMVDDLPAHHRPQPRAHMSHELTLRSGELPTVTVTDPTPPVSPAVVPAHVDVEREGSFS
jgi:transcriptional regulator, ArsR family